MNNRHLKKTDFYLDLKKLKNNYAMFNKLGSIYYPVKSNSNSIIIKELKKLYVNNNKNGFLIAYISHFHKLKRLGISASKMLAGSVLMIEQDIKYLYDHGVRFFTFDNIKSLKAFLKYANPKKIKIALRLNISEVFNVFSHLGATVNECLEMIDLLQKYGVSNYGISFYLQKELFTNTNSLNNILEFIKKKFKTHLEFIDIGGGIEPEDIDKDFLDKLLSEMKINELIMEPGRYLVGNAGHMETKIIRKKDENIFIIQNGIYSGLLDVKLVNKHFDLYAKINNRLVKLSYEKSKDKKELILCGNSNDSIDIIATLYIDNEYFNYLNEGTIIIVNDALTYVEDFFIPLGGDIIIKYIIINN